MPSNHIVQIPASAGSAPLTPAQKRFNTLVRQIGQQREALAAWHAAIPLYAKAHAKRIVPLIDALRREARERALALDRLLAEGGWSRAEQGLLRELICESVRQVLDAGDGGDADAALRALFDQHAEVDFETDQRLSRERLKSAVEAMTGVDLGDADELGSEEALFQRMREKLAAGAEDRAEATARGDGGGSHGSDARRPHERPRRPTPAQKRREAEAQAATQSVRDIFRKLASALHPDREADPERRGAKTALMQQANQAYAANDLLALLELQLRIEQIDASHIAAATPQRLKHYISVLVEQLDELKAEVARTEAGFRDDFGLELGPPGMNPAALPGLIDRGVRQLRGELEWREHEMRLLVDRPSVRRWLKSEQRRLREAESDGELFF